MSRAMKDYSAFIKEIRAVLPAERLYTDELRTLAWGTDASFYRLTPRVVVRAKDEAEADKIVGIERAKTDRMTAVVEAASDFASSVLGIGVGAAGTALGYVGLMKVLEFEQTGAVTSKTFNGCVSMLTKALRFR